MKISEMITDRYKLRIPPTVYYELLADVQEVEEEQEPTDNDVVLTYDMYHELIADRAEKLEQESILDKIRAEMKQIKPSQGHFYDGVAKCLEILDKYKAESEVDNGDNT